MAGTQKQQARQGTKATLGDVLYADKKESCSSEEEWVALVRAVAAGDQRALHGLYQRAHRPVYTLAMRFFGNRETAEELTVDIFHDVWRRASAYDPANGTVLGWIMNQARSRAIDRLRFDRRKKRVDPHPDESSLEAADGSPHALLEALERANRLHGAMGLLSMHERQAIEAAYFWDLTHAEAATRLNQPLGTIKTRIRSGLSKLRQALSGDS